MVGQVPGYVPEELSLSEGSIDYFFEESVRRMPVVDAPCRSDETISYSEFNDFAYRFATLPTFRGIEKGGRVAGYARDNLQLLRAQYGACAYSIAPYRPTAETPSPPISRSLISGLSPAPASR